jgi:hypothetical protein
MPRLLLRPVNTPVQPAERAVIRDVEADTFDLRGLPRLLEPPFRRAVPATPADQAGAHVDCFVAHASKKKRVCLNLQKVSADPLLGRLNLEISGREPSLVASTRSLGLSIRYGRALVRPTAQKSVPLEMLLTQPRNWRRTTFIGQRRRAALRGKLEVQKAHQMNFDQLFKNNVQI